MKRVVILVAVLCMQTAIAAKPNYQQARAIYDQLKQPFFDTGLFYKKSFNERIAYIDAAKSLRDRAEKLFGIPSQCFSAASMRYEYVTRLHDYSNRLEGRVNDPLDWKKITDPMYLAFSYGESTSGCYHDVEALDSKSSTK